MTLRVWHLIAVVTLAVVGVAAAAFALGQSSRQSPPRTVVAVPPLAAPSRSPAPDPDPNAEAAAAADVRSAIPAAETYYLTSGNESYTGLTPGALAAVAPGISPTLGVTVLTGGKSYCLEETAADGRSFFYLGGSPGPGLGTIAHKIAPGICP